MWVKRSLPFMLVDVIEDPLLRAEVGYSGGAALLCALLTIVYLRPAGRSSKAP